MAGAELARHLQARRVAVHRHHHAAALVGPHHHRQAHQADAEHQHRVAEPRVADVHAVQPDAGQHEGAGDVHRHAGGQEGGIGAPRVQHGVAGVRAGDGVHRLAVEQHPGAGAEVHQVAGGVGCHLRAGGLDHAGGHVAGAQRVADAVERPAHEHELGADADPRPQRADHHVTGTGIGQRNVAQGEIVLRIADQGLGIHGANLLVACAEPGPARPAAVSGSPFPGRCQAMRLGMPRAATARRTPAAPRAGSAGILPARRGACRGPRGSGTPARRYPKAA